MSRKISTTRPKNFSERLVNLRLGEKLTIHRLAELTKIPRSTLSEIENNKYNPSSLVLVRLSDFFDVNSTWLLTGEGDIYKSPEATPLVVNEAQPDYEPPKESQAAITEDYPLIKKLMNEAEEGARNGLNEDELLDMLVKILEAEQIKRRRRPAPYLEDTLLDTVRDILINEVPPEDTKERRKCMLELEQILKMKPNDEASRRV